MRIRLRNNLIKEIGYQKLKKYGVNKENHFRWYSDLEINLNELTKEEQQELINLLTNYKDSRGAKTAIRDIQTWMDLKQKKLRTIKRVKDFEPALIEYLKDVNGHRVFTHDSLESDAVLCYRVTEVEYKQKEVHQYSTTPEHVNATLAYKKFGIEYEKKIVFWGEDIRFKTVPEALALQGLEKETEQLRQQYLDDVKVYIKTKDQIGKQYIANGIGVDGTLDDKENDRRYRKLAIGKTFTFNNNRVVIDVFLENESEYDSHQDHVEDGAWFWSNVRKRHDEEDFDNEDSIDELPEEEQHIEIPIHTHVVVFDLLRHLRLVTHINYLTEYKYDDDLADKLVLNKEVKDLVEVLIKHKEGGFQDIIKGKSGGTVILLSGAAGTGKTLTAEVFAEYEKKPLYNVQASQLGLNPEELEEELKRVLIRSSRWDAVLLVDEADVYVYERGNNINQNAIVGVFLRVLEYHDSTLFLTTNRPDIVDDAIISRCVAKIDYQYPTKEQQIEIWNIISKSAKINIDEDIIKEFVNLHNNYSGRDIKNLIKLSNLKSIADNKPITKETIEFITKFNPSLNQNGETKNG